MARGARLIREGTAAAFRSLGEPEPGGTDIGHTLAQEAPQAFTEAVVNVDSY